MSAEVESMFSTREMPWHGLSKIVKDSPTSEEAIIDAGLNWTVNPKPLYRVGRNRKIVKVSGAIVNVRSTDEAELGIVTSRYKIVQNSEAFAFTDALLTGGVRYETAGSLFGGKKVWLLAKLPGVKVLGEDYGNYLAFINSHDGKGAVRVVPTKVRIVCNNTLNLALRSSVRSWSTKHVGDMANKMEEASRALELNDLYMKEFNKTAEEMANTKISNDNVIQMINTIFPIADDVEEGRAVTVATRQREVLTQVYFDTPDIANFRGTKWGVIQAVSDMAYHANPVRRTDTFTEKRLASAFEGNALLDQAYTLLSA